MTMITILQSRWKRHCGINVIVADVESVHCRSVQSCNNKFTMTTVKKIGLYYIRLHVGFGVSLTETVRSRLTIRTGGTNYESLPVIDLMRTR